MTGDYSQNGEQVVIDEILARLGLSSGTLVDLGAGDGWALSNTRHLLHHGWRGVMIDADNRGNCEVHQHFLTAENVVGVVSSYTPSADVLSIDLDGNDYWILNAFLASFTPALIVCEVNPRFEREEVKVMAYNPEHRWQGLDYYGMSIGAVEVLCRRFGYGLYDYNGLNAFLIRSDLGVPPKNWQYTPRFDHPPGQGEWTTLV